MITDTGSDASARARWRLSHVGIAWIFGLVFAALTLDPSYITGRGPYWDAPIGDVAKGEIGWVYYARDSWRFPVFYSGTYHYPEGANGLLSDSLPLFALPYKIAFKLTSTPDLRPPIYTGLWVFLCLLLQALAASRLLRVLGVGDAAAHAAGIALFCYLPIVLLRFGQPGLM